jgi:AcrR family transcriptional regulator
MARTTSLRQVKRERTAEAIARAAWSLFAERGFESVTMSEIAAAAEVGERTMFRYFADKEELLFGEDDAVQAQLLAALATRPASESPAVAVREAVVSLAGLWQDRHEEGRARQSIIAGSPALTARARAKHAAHEVLLARGLEERGCPAPRARLLARTAVGCMDEAVTRWLGDDDPLRPGLEARAHEVFAELAEVLS